MSYRVLPNCAVIRTMCVWEWLIHYEQPQEEVLRHIETTNFSLSYYRLANLEHD